MKKSIKVRKPKSVQYDSPEERRAWFVRQQMDALLESIERFDELDSQFPCRTQYHKRGRSHFVAKYSYV